MMRSMLRPHLLACVGSDMKDVYTPLPSVPARKKLCHRGPTCLLTCKVTGDPQRDHRICFPSPYVWQYCRQGPHVILEATYDPQHIHNPLPTKALL